MRDFLIRLAIEHEGNYFRIRKAIQQHAKIEKDIKTQPAITILDKDYPRQLLDLKYPPYVLFYKGDRELLKERMCAVVGSRAVSGYGVKVTEMVVDALKKRYVIVSGMAKGIDAIAHERALRTIGILGNGIDVEYPDCNKGLYQYMGKNQLLLSEYPSGSRPEKYHFPFRNRIIAALGEKVVVTQAGVKSGSMLTVNEALNISRDIYVVPYRLTDSEGAGCNRLISQGANLVQIIFSENN